MNKPSTNAASPVGMLRHILVVDDDQTILELTKLVLVHLGGYNVETCASGIKALEVSETLQPDLVILDVMMPRMSGVDCLVELRKRGFEFPVIFLTAKGHRAKKSLGLLDCIGVLSKPFQPMDLVKDIQAIWLNKGNEPGKLGIMR